MHDGVHGLVLLWVFAARVPNAHTAGVVVPLTETFRDGQIRGIGQLGSLQQNPGVQVCFGTSDKQVLADKRLRWGSSTSTFLVCIMVEAIAVIKTSCNHTIVNMCRMQMPGAFLLELAPL
jgi:hypothetical protein